LYYFYVCFTIDKRLPPDAVEKLVNLFFAKLQYVLSISIPINDLVFKNMQMAPVVPLPQNGSSTISFSFVEARTMRFN